MSDLVPDDSATTDGLVNSYTVAATSHGGVVSAALSSNIGLQIGHCCAALGWSHSAGVHLLIDDSLSGADLFALVSGVIAGRNRQSYGQKQKFHDFLHIPRERYAESYLATEGGK